MSAGPDQTPVEVGETYHIEIEELGEEGDGIGYVGEFVVIVPGATLGESVTIEVERVEDSYAVAAAIDPPGTED